MLDAVSNERTVSNVQTDYHTPKKLEKEVLRMFCFGLVNDDIYFKH